MATEETQKDIPETDDTKKSEKEEDEPKTFTFESILFHATYVCNSYSYTSLINNNSLKTNQRGPTAARSSSRRLPTLPWLLHASHQATSQSAENPSGRSTTFQTSRRDRNAFGESACRWTIPTHSIGVGRTQLGVCDAVETGGEYGATEKVSFDTEAEKGLFVCVTVGRAL